MSESDGSSHQVADPVLYYHPRRHVLLVHGEDHVVLGNKVCIPVHEQRRFSGRDLVEVPLGADSGWMGARKRASGPAGLASTEESSARGGERCRAGRGAK